MARQKPRSYLVRVDPEIFVDVDWVEQCSISARAAYVDSLFFLAALGEPEGMYPHAVLVEQMGRRANDVARQLTSYGVWDFVGLGYAVRPYCGWRIVPEQRAAIPATVRRAVYKRDGHACLECGAVEDLTLDHIYPWSLGGGDTVENLRVLCRSCNTRKGAKV